MNFWMMLRRFFFTLGSDDVIRYFKDEAAAKKKKPKPKREIPLADILIFKEVASPEHGPVLSIVTSSFGEMKIAPGAPAEAQAWAAAISKVIPPTK